MSIIIDMAGSISLKRLIYKHFLPLFCTLTVVLMLPSKVQAATAIGWLELDSSVAYSYANGLFVRSWSLIELQETSNKNYYNLTLDVAIPITVSQSFYFPTSGTNASAGYVLAYASRDFVISLDFSTLSDFGLRVVDWGFYGYDSNSMGTSRVIFNTPSATGYTQNISWRGDFSGYNLGNVSYSFILYGKIALNGELSVSTLNVGQYLPSLSIALSGVLGSKVYDVPSVVWNQLESIIDLEYARNNQLLAFQTLFASYTTQNHNDISSFSSQNHSDLNNIDQDLLNLITIQTKFASDNHLDIQSVIQNMNNNHKDVMQYLGSGSDDQIINSDSGLQTVVTDRDNQQDQILGSADKNIDSLDSVGGLDILSDYSQSTTFWMNCVSTIQADLSQLWGILIFGFIVSFAGWILRMRH